MQTDNQPTADPSGGGDPELLAALEKGDWQTVLDFAKRNALEALAELQEVIRKHEGLLMRANVYGRMGTLALLNLGKTAKDAEREVKQWRR